MYVCRQAQLLTSRIDEHEMVDGGDGLVCAPVNYYAKLSLVGSLGKVACRVCGVCYICYCLSIVKEWEKSQFSSGVVIFIR